MPIQPEVYKDLITRLNNGHVQLVAVSKLQPVEDIQDLYNLGQKDFGENYVQELAEKQPLLPADIRWHFIGHLQSNKVKYIASFVSLIQGVDTYKLLVEISKQGKKVNRVIHCLLQVHIAQEETKFGLDAAELEEIISAIRNKNPQLSHVQVDGLMGMASYSDDLDKVRGEMSSLKFLFEKYQLKAGDDDTNNPLLSTLSMGMSADYAIAIEEGSNMVRIGSLLFGARPKK